MHTTPDDRQKLRSKLRTSQRRASTLDTREVLANLCRIWLDQKYSQNLLRVQNSTNQIIIKVSENLRPVVLPKDSVPPPAPIFPTYASPIKRTPSPTHVHRPPTPLDEVEIHHQHIERRLVRCFFFFFKSNNEMGWAYCWC